MKQLKEMTTRELEREKNIRIADWQIDFVSSEMKGELVSEINREQVRRLLLNFKKK